MKKFILSALLLPFADKTGFNTFPPESKNLVEVRAGAWPINMERDIEPSGTSYSLIFRNQEVMTGVSLDTLEFPNLGQLQYFEKALTVLKTGTNGDIAKFSDYSIKKVLKKYDSTWYLLRLKWSSTEFRQSEADIMRKTIKGL
jgi:hypothetical protein